jgi:hypothetical protein
MVQLFKFDSTIVDLSPTCSSRGDLIEEQVGRGGAQSKSRAAQNMFAI